MSIRYKYMAPQIIKLRYTGKVTFDLVDSLLHIVLKRLEEIEENVTLRKKVYNILMECSQNLCIHVDPQSQHHTYDTSSILISIQKKEGNYKITTGNFLSNEKVTPLKDVLEEINKTSREELKTLYNKVLTNNNYSQKGGGGLGLIDIARRSDGKLNYTLEPVDDKYSFFKLKVRIKKTQAV